MRKSPKDVAERSTPEELVALIERSKELAGDERTRLYLERAIADVERVGRVGRKPKPANKLRDRKFMIRFNGDELETIAAALDGSDVEIAVGLRELALEAAAARVEKSRYQS